MDVWVVSSFWLLWLVLLWTLKIAGQSMSLLCWLPHVFQAQNKLTSFHHGLGSPTWPGSCLPLWLLSSLCCSLNTPRWECSLPRYSQDSLLYFADVSNQVYHFLTEACSSITPDLAIFFFIGFSISDVVLLLCLPFFSPLECKFYDRWDFFTAVSSVPGTY